MSFDTELEFVLMQFVIVCVTSRLTNGGSVYYTDTQLHPSHPTNITNTPPSERLLWEAQKTFDSSSEINIRKVP